MRVRCLVASEERAWISGNSHGRKSEVKALTEVSLDRLGLRTRNVVQVAEDVHEL